MVTSFNEGDWQNDFTREKKLHKEKKFYKISLQVRETNKKYHTRVFYHSISSFEKNPL